MSSASAARSRLPSQARRAICKASRSASSTMSAKVRPVARDYIGICGKMSSAVTSPPEHSATDCSTMFSTSRTLPG